MRRDTSTTGDARALEEVNLHSFVDLPPGDYLLLYADVEPQGMCWYVDSPCPHNSQHTGAKPTTTLRCIKLTPTKLVISQHAQDGATQTADVDVPAVVGAGTIHVARIYPSQPPATDGKPKLPDLVQRFEQGLTAAPKTDERTTKPDAPHVPSTHRPPPLVNNDDPLLDDRLRVPVGGVGSSDLYPAGMVDQQHGDAMLYSRFQGGTHWWIRCADQGCLEAACTWVRGTRCLVGTRQGGDLCLEAHLVGGGTPLLLQGCRYVGCFVLDACYGQFHRGLHLTILCVGLAVHTLMCSPLDLGVDLIGIRCLVDSSCNYTLYRCAWNIKGSSFVRVTCVVKIPQY